jgi:phosphopantothenoylcysteine synthetase/decarboxylase
LIPPKPLLDVVVAAIVRSLLANGSDDDVVGNDGAHDNEEDPFGTGNIDVEGDDPTELFLCNNVTLADDTVSPGTPNVMAFGMMTLSHRLS